MGRPKKIPTVVRAPKYGSFTFFTAGKEYDVQELTYSGSAFILFDDDGKKSSCLVKNCAYLRCKKTGRQYQWKIVKSKNA